MPGRNYQSSTAYRYGFNGQEKDDEVFQGAMTAQFWEYDSRLGRRWNVDPMFSKKAWQAPYHAFSNRPTSNIDPNGADDFEINKKGEITKRTENKEADNFFGVDDNGERIKDKVLSFKYGTIKSVENPSIKAQDSKGNVTSEKLTLFTVDGDENAQKLFEFGADFSGEENVEWSVAKIGSKESGENIVGTMHTPGKSGVGDYIGQKYSNLRGLDHSHPNGAGYPSGADQGQAKKYQAANSGVILNIYIPRTILPNGLYIRYNDKGTIDIEPQWYFPEINIDSGK
jgi:hypothetical protein